jgi:hypothetical protein
MQTICEAAQDARTINFLFMAKAEKKISSTPLFGRLSKGGAAKIAEQLNVSEQVISNWKRRGVPAAEVGRIAAVLGISYEQYMLEAGRPLNVAQPAQYTLAEMETVRGALKQALAILEKRAEAPVTIVRKPLFSTLDGNKSPSPDEKIKQRTRG